MKTSGWVIGSILLAAGLGTGGYVYWNGNQRPPVKYKTAKIERGTITQVVTATGTVNPVITVQVGSQVSGIIKELHADFNSVVKAGQVVARIDPAPFQAKVTETEATLQSALGNLARARADLALRKLELDRAQTLFEQQLNARADLDNAQTAYATSLAGIEVAEAQVKQARAAMEKAKLDLQYTTIHSPVNGIVISRNVDVGQTVAASFQTPVLFVVAKDLTKMQVDTNVSESDIGGATEGKPATFLVDAYPDQLFKGKVVQVRNAPITVQNVVTYNVVIGVDNSDLRLRPGMTATVSLIIDRRENVLKVPNQALRFKPALLRVAEKGNGVQASADGDRKSGAKGGERQSKPTVWLPGPQGEPAPAELQTGITDGTFTAVLEGPLKEGDEVIVGLDMPRGPHGGSGSSLPPGFGPQPSQRPSSRAPRGI